MASIDGLASGLNTTDIIRQLMTLERQPQVRLQSQKQAVEGSISALRGLNGKFAAVASAADKLLTPTGWQPTKATSSDPTTVAVSSTPGAPRGSVTFTVNRLATAATVLSHDFVTDREAAGTVLPADSRILIKKGSDPSEPGTTVETGDGSLNAVINAINRSGAGVSATALQLESGKFRLQLTSTTTGEESAFTVQQQAPDDSLSPLAWSLGTLDPVPAGDPSGQDAEIVVHGQVVTRPSNTVSDLLQGATLTLSKADGVTPVTVSITRDDEALTGQVQALVDAVNAARGETNRLTAFDLESKKKGPLYGDSSVRGAGERLLSAVRGTPGGLGAFGITTSRDGTLKLDKDTLLKAVEADPGKVMAALGKDGLAGRLEAAAKAVSRSAASEDGPGVLANAIAGRERQSRTLSSSITSWDTRLEQRESRLRAQFASLEKAMSSAQQQSSWLAGQIAGLPRWGG